MGDFSGVDVFGRIRDVVCGGSIIDDGVFEEGFSGRAANYLGFCVSVDVVCICCILLKMWR